MKYIILLLALLFVSFSILQAQDTMDVSGGWNIIGAISTRAVSDIRTEQPGIITSIDSGGWTCGSQISYAGKTYNTVQIDAQCWLKENLDVGTMITGSENQTNNSTLEQYCYDDNPANCNAYGGLYQWNEAMQYSTTPGAQGICPRGWHIPTHAELETLAVKVNQDGNALKAIGEGTRLGVGTNTSGFSALLSGSRSYDGNFTSLGSTAYFWSSTEYNATYAGYVNLLNDDSSIYFYLDNKECGFSVRCLKD